MTAPTTEHHAQAADDQVDPVACEVIHVLLIIREDGAHARREHRCGRTATGRLIAACAAGHVETVQVCDQCREGILAGAPTGCDTCNQLTTIVAIESLR